MTDDTQPDRSARDLAVAATVINVFLLVALGLGFGVSRSMLALTQAADSFFDLLLSALLIYATRVASQPRDAGHPGGHYAAEPIAALVVAVAAGVMAVEVTISAVERLLSGYQVALPWPLLVVFVAKGTLKLGLALVALRVFRRTRRPSARAIWIDSRNDALVGVVAVLGWILVRTGQPAWDAWLALPTAAWIARSGALLAKDNIGLLMGTAASDTRHREIEEVVLRIPGVQSVHGLSVRHHGTHLDVTVHVVLDDTLSLREAHDIGVRVSDALEGAPDVAHAAVHLDVEDDEADEAGGATAAR